MEVDRPVPTGLVEEDGFAGVFPGLPLLIGVMLSFCFRRASASAFALSASEGPNRIKSESED